MQRLPVGIQSFDMLRNKNLVYVDKTKQIYDLVTGKRGYYFFLSRPRRFGKSLLISTLKELFLGNKHLFESLWIAQSDYDWQSHHVIHLDFSLITSRTTEELRTNFSHVIYNIAASYSLPVNVNESLEIVFEKLITHLAQTKNVVLLIDEYDRPLLQHVGNLAVMRQSIGRENIIPLYDGGYQVFKNIYFFRYEQSH
jgi:hypothetical protein